MKMNMKNLKKMLSMKSLKKNHENVLIAVLAVVLLVLVVMYVNKNRENFEGENVTVVYFFHVDWCGYCKKAKPEVDKFVQKLAENDNKVNGKSVKVVQVNADENKELAAEYNVRAYPTVIVSKPDGSHKEFEEACTFDNLNNYPF
jgi:thiol-disulfide isomerase/thioredoxin